MRLLRLPGVFWPPSDAWLLAEALRDEPLVTGGRVLDLCTGSGLLALTAAQAGARSVTAVDVSRRAVIAARLNARLNGLRVEVLRGDLFAPVAGRHFEMIVSNPPYLPSASDQLPRRGLARATDAGTDGRVFLERICTKAPAHLEPGGVLLIVHSSACDEPETLRSLERAGFQAQRVARVEGPLGPRMRERLPLLLERGLLDGDREEIVVIRAQRPSAAVPPARARVLSARVGAGSG